MVDSASIQIEEAGGELAAYAQRGWTSIPSALPKSSNRVSAIFSTARKLKLPPERLLAHLRDLQSQASTRSMGAGDLDVLERVAGHRRNGVPTAGRQPLSASRRRASATRLADGVSGEIDRLGMAGRDASVAYDPAPPRTSSGSDAIEFRIAAHDGATPRPIARVASGGELSRIGLAISVLASQANPLPTLIFDEADAGIGGAVAAVVGELMQRLADGHQVFCVTHLAQVACRADHHLRVSKTTASGGVGSRVRAALGGPAGRRNCADAGRHGR